MLKGLHDYDNAKNQLFAIVQQTISITEFEMRWNQFITDHALQNNEWLASLYAEREQWVPVFLRHLFWVDM